MVRKPLGGGGPPAGGGGRRPFTGGGPPKRRSAAGLLVYGDWVTGYNDDAPTCVATAIANSLLAVTGERVTDDDVYLLFRQAGGCGMSVADALAALGRHGIGGHRPVACGVRESPLASGDIVGLNGTHAACNTPAGLISWGTSLSRDWEPDGEVWRIDWQ